MEPLYYKISGILKTTLENTMDISLSAFETFYDYDTFWSNGNLDTFSVGKIIPEDHIPKAIKKKWRQKL